MDRRGDHRRARIDRMGMLLQRLIWHGLRLSLLLVVFAGIGGTVWYGYNLENRNTVSEVTPVIRPAAGPTRRPYAGMRKGLDATPGAGPPPLKLEQPPTMENLLLRSDRTGSVPDAGKSAETVGKMQETADHDQSSASLQPVVRDMEKDKVALAASLTEQMDGKTRSNKVVGEISRLVEEAGAKGRVEQRPVLRAGAVPNAVVPGSPAEKGPTPATEMPPVSSADTQDHEPGAALPWALLSVVDSNGRRLALLQRRETHEILALFPGQYIFGWRVHDIRPDSLVLSRGELRRALILGEGVTASDINLSAAIGKRQETGGPGKEQKADSTSDSRVSATRNDGTASPDGSDKSSADAGPLMTEIVGPPAPGPEGTPMTGKLPADAISRSHGSDGRGTRDASSINQEAIERLRDIAPAAGPATAPRISDARARLLPEYEKTAIEALGSAGGTVQVTTTTDDTLKVGAIQVPSPSADGTGTANQYRAQLAALRAAADAEREWARLQTQYKELLGKREHWVVPVDLGTRGRFYRLQTGPLADETAASRFCEEVKARQLACLVVRLK